MTDDITERLMQRYRAISDWLAVACPECDMEQGHLNEGSRDRAYWHYGYAVAVKDVLGLLGLDATRGSVQ